MKKIKILLATISVLMFVSCSNDSGGSSSSTYYVKSTVDGVETVWDSQIQAKTFHLGSDGVSFLLLAVKSNGNSINLHLTDGFTTTFQPQSFPLDYASVGCIETIGMTAYASDYGDFTTSPGTIAITEVNTTNHTVKGTFNFIGKTDPETVSRTHTSGEFYVKYTEE